MNHTRERIREAYGTSAGIATENPLASMVGIKTMAMGGNAVDAAIAISFALSVLIPHLGGLGGDYFALIRKPEGGVVFINGSGQAPKLLTRDLFLEKGLKTIPSRGPLSPTVPGMIDALYNLWMKYGSIEWSKLVKPAMELAKKGFPASPSLVESINSYASFLNNDPGSKRTYLINKPSKPGERVRFPGLGRLLEEIMEDPRSFYDGPIAEKLTEYLRERGGVISEEDLKAYHSFYDDPISVDYNGWILWEMPPNTQGTTTLHIMKILEQWEIPRDPIDRLYYLLSASKVSYEAKDREIGDPKYMSLTVKELLSDEYIGMLRSIASEGPPRCTKLSHREDSYGDTTFYTVIDSEGWMVAGIQSLFYPFGSGITEPVYQVTLNGRASGFTLENNRPNTLAPFKRPLHTLSAVIAESGKRIVSIGTSGGHFRPQQHALLLTSLIDHGYSVGEAIALPRLLWQPGTCKIHIDADLDITSTLPGYQFVRGRTGVANGIMVDEEFIVAATDYRGDGYPLVL